MNIRSGTKKYIILEIVLGILVVVFAGSMLFRTRKRTLIKSRLYFLIRTAVSGHR